VEHVNDNFLAITHEVRGDGGYFEEEWLRSGAGRLVGRRGKNGWFGMAECACSI
jgi:hypothetical protein